MAFEEYTGKKKAAPAVKDPNYVGVCVADGTGKSAGKYTLSITLGPSVMKERKWAQGEKVAVHFGTGLDKGKMLIKKGESGFTLTRYGRAPKDATESVASKVMFVVDITVNALKEFNKAVLPTTKTAFEWDETQQGLMVVLPESFFTESAPAS